MAVKYRRFDGELVSAEWHGLLVDLRYVDRVQFYLTEGKRTKARQQELLNEKGLWSPANPFGAAAVSDTAPHIRTGRKDHALDLIRAKGAAGGTPQAMLNAAQKRGVTLKKTVPTEDWHREADLGELERYRARRTVRIRDLRRRVGAARERYLRLRNLYKRRTR